MTGSKGSRYSFISHNKTIRILQKQISTEISNKMEGHHWLNSVAIATDQPEGRGDRPLLLRSARRPHGRHVRGQCFSDRQLVSTVRTFWHFFMCADSRSSLEGAPRSFPCVADSVPMEESPFFTTWTTRIHSCPSSAQRGSSTPSECLTSFNINWLWTQVILLFPKQLDNHFHVVQWIDFRLLMLRLPFFRNTESNICEPRFVWISAMQTRLRNSARTAPAHNSAANCAWLRGATWTSRTNRKSQFGALVSKILHQSKSVSNARIHALEKCKWFTCLSVLNTGPDRAWGPTRTKRRHGRSRNFRAAGAARGTRNPRRQGRPRHPGRQRAPGLPRPSRSSGCARCNWAEGRERTARTSRSTRLLNRGRPQTQRRCVYQQECETPGFDQTCLFLWTEQPTRLPKWFATRYTCDCSWRCVCDAEGGRLWVRERSAASQPHPRPHHLAPHPHSARE